MAGRCARTVGRLRVKVHGERDEPAGRDAREQVLGALRTLRARSSAEPLRASDVREDLADNLVDRTILGVVHTHRPSLKPSDAAQHSNLWRHLRRHLRSPLGRSPLRWTRVSGDSARTQGLRSTARLVRRVFPRSELTVRFRPLWGLGNHLFQIAGSYAIATDRGVDLLLPRDWRYRQFFSIPNAWFAGSLLTRRCEEAWQFATRIEPAWARPHLQDVHLWQGRESDIHALLQPSDRVLDAMMTTFGDQLDIASKTAIHVRRGDYLSSETTLRPCPLSYYDAAIELIAAESPETQFLVFSDDIAFAVALETPLDEPSDLAAQASAAVRGSLLKACPCRCRNGRADDHRRWFIHDPDPIVKCALPSSRLK